MLIIIALKLTIVALIDDVSPFLHPMFCYEYIELFNVLSHVSSL